VLRLPMVREVRPGTDFAHYRALLRHLEAVQPDVVHTHSSKAGVLGRAASIASGTGLRVHTPHTFAFLFEAMFAPLKRRLYREIEGWLAGHTHAIVAVSASEARTFIASGVVESRRVHVVANGIDAAAFTGARAVDRASLGFRADAPLAAVVGLLNVAKGQDLALEALVESGLSDLQLMFVGHGEEEARLVSQAQALGVAARVRFLGFRTDVARLLAAADFVLVPSRWEGMPYIVLEAMASARPVVTTPVDGALDLVQHGVHGFVAREISAAALAEAVRELLARTPLERRKMGESGRTRVLARHRVDRMVDELIELYGALA
jgi:glycosyltransferase involved in cell wall biosynthesis